MSFSTGWATIARRADAAICFAGRADRQDFLISQRRENTVPCSFQKNKWAFRRLLRACLARRVSDLT